MQLNTQFLYFPCCLIVLLCIGTSRAEWLNRPGPYNPPTQATPNLGSTPVVDVSAFGARGDGKSDDTQALQTAINTMPSGATLAFGSSNQVYLITARLTLRPNMIYQGHGTIRMGRTVAAHTAIAKLQYGAADNVTIQGLTFDANGVGGGLQIAVDGGGAIPAHGLHINHMIFRNTTATPAGPWDAALYAPVGLIKSQITYNQVINCALGMYLTNPGSLTVSQNSFQTVHLGDAISITFAPGPFAYGQNILISGNSGQHLGRMGIEIWPSGGNIAQTSQVENMVISGNTFSEWDPGYNTDTFGISIMAGRQHQVSANKLIGLDGGLGIELGATQSLIEQNTVQGFSTGIVLHDSADSTVVGNMLSAQTRSGIEFSNAPGSRTHINIQNNSITNSQIFGIMVNTANWGGTTISGNFISRSDGVFSTDQEQAFTGIATTPPATPVTVVGNSITQPALTGPPQFSFMGIRINGDAGANASSAYKDNTVISHLLLPQSVGLFGNSPGSLDGVIIEGNTFTGLYSASGGAGSSGAVISGNVVYDCIVAGPVNLVP